jgi:hypothetical protein
VNNKKPALRHRFFPWRTAVLCSNSHVKNEEFSNLLSLQNNAGKKVDWRPPTTQGPQYRDKVQVSNEFTGEMEEKREVQGEKEREKRTNTL